MSTRPRFALNPLLVHGTIEPPVSIARSWVYPKPNIAPEPHLPLINLSQGVPGVHPPPEFQEQLHRQPIDWGYGDTFGSPALRQAVARDLNHVYRRNLPLSRGSVRVEDVCITAGSNLAFATIVQVLAARGDAILLPTPWYFNHYMTLTSLGIEAIPVPTHAPVFQVDLDSVRSALASARHRGTAPKALVIVTPNNPTGAVYNADLLAQLALLTRQEEIALILDETYKDFLLDAPSQSDLSHTRHRATPHTLFQDSLPNQGSEEWNWRDTVVQLLSFSKSFAIPGHRLGALIAHPSLLATVDQALDPTKDIHAPDQVNSNVQHYGPVAKVLDDLQISPPVGSTQAVVACAMHDPMMVQWRAKEADAIQTRRETFAQALNQLDVRSVPDGSWHVESSGGYYAYVRHPWAKYLDSEAVSRALATIVGVKTLPGVFFMPPRSSGSGIPTPALASSFPTRPGWTADDPADRVRFSVANVDLDTIKNVPDRLALLDRLWAEKGIGYGL